MYAVKVDMPNMDAGAQVEIDGLGFFTNGEVSVFNDGVAEAFEVKHHKSVLDVEIYGCTFKDLGEDPEPEVEVDTEVKDAKLNLVKDNDDDDKGGETE